MNNELTARGHLLEIAKREYKVNLEEVHDYMIRVEKVVELMESYHKAKVKELIERVKEVMPYNSDAKEVILQILEG